MVKARKPGEGIVEEMGYQLTSFRWEAKQKGQGVRQPCPCRFFAPCGPYPNPVELLILENLGYWAIDSTPILAEQQPVQHVALAVCVEIALAGINAGIIAINPAPVLTEQEPIQHVAFPVVVKVAFADIGANRLEVEDPYRHKLRDRTICPPTRRIAPCPDIVVLIPGKG
jgi:hypothetical protein